MHILFALAFIVSLLSFFSGQGLAQPAKHDRPQEGKLRVGDVAPDFELDSLDGKGKVKLSSFQGKQPVALIFGSYT